MTDSESRLPPPTGIAIVVCDNVYTDSGGKRALVGLFNKISSSQFPAIHNRLCVFVSLTSLRLTTVCKLEIVHAETDEAIVEMQGPLPHDNPTTICDMVFELRGLQFPEPGKYFIRFSGKDGITLLERPIEVALISTPPEEPSDADEN